tara:strand:- start:193 stop:354 length:162 start_codon:yes stop_codon:yes gene_type:complete
MEDLRTEKEILHNIENQVQKNSFTYKEFGIAVVTVFTVFTIAMSAILLVKVCI